VLRHQPFFTFSQKSRDFRGVGVVNRQLHSQPRFRGVVGEMRCFANYCTTIARWPNSLTRNQLYDLSRDRRRCVSSALVGSRVILLSYGKSSAICTWYGCSRSAVA